MKVDKVLAAVALFIPALFMGCSAAPKLANMICEPPPSTYRSFDKTVFVSEERDAPQASGVSQALFVDALRISTEKSNLFQVVDSPTNADYHLFTSIVDYGHPADGFTMTCRLTVRYTLKRPSTPEPVWRAEIVAAKTCGTNDALVATTRQRLTIEGAVQKNIEQALKKLSTLEL